MVIVLLYASGALLLLIALELFLTRPVYRLHVTARDAANFAGDVEAWVRNASQ